MSICHTFSNGSIIHVSLLCVCNKCLEISICVRVRVREYMHEYVSHAPLSSPLGFEFWCPSFSSSTAHWTQWTFCCLHSPPPPARSVSIYLSHTLSCSSILPPSLSYFLPAAPYSTSLSHALTLSCVLRLFHLATLPPPLFITVPLCIYLCRSRLIQTQTVSNSIRFRQTLRVSLCVRVVSFGVCRCVARERDRQKRRRWQQEERKEGCDWKSMDVGAFQTVKARSGNLLQIHFLLYLLKFSLHPDNNQ